MNAMNWLGRIASVTCATTGDVSGTVERLLATVLDTARYFLT